jgi:hypothetical protein
MEKQSSLFCPAVVDEKKKFDNIDFREKVAQTSKTFTRVFRAYIRDCNSLQTSVQLFKASLHCRAWREC